MMKTPSQTTVKSYTYRFGCGVLAICLCLGTWIGMLAVGTGAAAVKVPYLLCVEELSGQRVDFRQEYMYISSGHELGIDEAIQISGWIATPEGISHYECAWIPVTGGVPQWRDVDDQEMIPRPDLTWAETAYASGHGTAGYSLCVYPDDFMEDGCYDLYIRAVTGGDQFCDVLLLPNVVYGAPDVERDGCLSMSLSRLEREHGALRNAVIMEEGILRMGSGGMVRLGDYHLSAFESLRVTYSVPQAFETEKQAVLGLKSSGDYVYGDGAGKYNITDNLLYFPIDTSQVDTVKTVEINLKQSGITYAGDLYLCGYTAGQIDIHGVDLIYEGQAHSRTAAKIYFSEDMLSYLDGIQKMSLSGYTDPIFGDVLRFSVTEDTNDPYVFFHTENLMKAHDVRLTADEYKYVVVLAKAASHNLNSRIGLYLCAGTIVGPTEDCTYNWELTLDDQWHYYLLDLSELGTWRGRIHGWRFDMINAPAHAGDYVDVATVQFFRTAAAAQRAAAGDVSVCDTPYAKGQPLLFADMQEEQQGTGNSGFVISPEDAYEVTVEETTLPEDVYEETFAETLVLVPPEVEATMAETLGLIQPEAEVTASETSDDEMSETEATVGETLPSSEELEASCQETLAEETESIQTEEQNSSNALDSDDGISNTQPMESEATASSTDTAAAIQQDGGCASAIEGMIPLMVLGLLSVLSLLWRIGRKKHMTTI